MVSFLQKLKKKNIVPPSEEDLQQQKTEEQKNVTQEDTTGIAQLKVDIFQTPAAIIIYTQIAGASIHDFSVLVEGDGDVVTIKGQRIRPNGEIFENHDSQNVEHVLEECAWGKFYRQIILPTEVESSKAEAKMKEGVLMLLLPLKESSEKGVRLNVVKI